jgi:hypothetical protein
MMKFCTIAARNKKISWRASNSPRHERRPAQ